MTDGNVTFHREGGDGQHGGIGGHFGEHALQDAYAIGEGIRVGTPEIIELLGNTCQETGISKHIIKLKLSVYSQIK